MNLHRGIISLSVARHPWGATSRTHYLTFIPTHVIIVFVIEGVLRRQEALNYDMVAKRIEDLNGTQILDIFIQNQINKSYPRGLR